MEQDWITVWAPASVANVGPGFDSFGFALQGLGDRVQIRASANAGLRIDDIRLAHNYTLPFAIHENTASIAAIHLLKRYNSILPEELGWDMRIEKGLPLCSGLGSSAASAAAGAYAMATILKRHHGIICSQRAVFEAALAGEEAAAGSVHADNIAPAIQGGFTIVGSLQPLQVWRFVPKLELHIALITPLISVPTKQARQVLPATVNFHEHVQETARAASLIFGLLAQEGKALQAAFQDNIVTQRRAQLIPGFAELHDVAQQEGCLGFSISGSGPTVFALCEIREQAQHIVRQWQNILEKQGLEAETNVTSIDTEGVRVV